MVQESPDRNPDSIPVIVTRLQHFISRWREARKFGVHFRGMKNQQPLINLTFSSGVRSIKSLGNDGYWHDFVNVILDDEYGLRSLPVPPLRILDVGGNIGLFSIWARHCFSNAVIHCYEPNPKLASLLKENLSGLNVTIFHEAVSTAAGNGIIIESNDSRCVRLILTSTGTIPVVSIESALDQIGGKVDFLKMDIEGGEWMLLRGAGPSAFSRIGRIHMEYHQTEEGDLDDLKLAAKHHGYKIVHLNQNNGFGIAWLKNSSVGQL